MMSIKRRVFVVVVAALAIAALTAGVVFASSSSTSEVTVDDKTIILESYDFGFIISNDRIQDLVDSLKARGYEGCRFVSQVENGVPVKDSATGVTFLTYDGDVSFEEGADIYNIDNVSIDFLIKGEMDRGGRPLVGMFETEFGEFDLFNV